jgi:gas vesicle protein
MASNDSDFGAFLSGFVVGGLVGAAVALLLAPQSGEETRTVIRDTTMERTGVARDKLGEVTTGARSRVSETAQLVKERTSTVTEPIRERASGLQEQSQLVLEEQRARLEKAIEAGKEAAKRNKEEKVVEIKDEETEV